MKPWLHRNGSHNQYESDPEEVGPITGDVEEDDLVQGESKVQSVEGFAGLPYTLLLWQSLMYEPLQYICFIAVGELPPLLHGHCQQFPLAHSHTDAYLPILHVVKKQELPMCITKFE